MEIPRLGLNWSCSRRPIPQPRHLQAASAAYTTAHSSTRSLTHRVRPGIEPTSSWILVRFVTTRPQKDLQRFCFLSLSLVHPFDDYLKRKGPREMIWLISLILGRLYSMSKSSVTISSCSHFHFHSLLITYYVPATALEQPIVYRLNLV